jgi:hypothetical protein
MALMLGHEWQHTYIYIREGCVCKDGCIYIDKYMPGVYNVSFISRSFILWMMQLACA